MGRVFSYGEESLLILPNMYILDTYVGQGFI